MKDEYSFIDLLQKTLQNIAPYLLTIFLAAWGGLVNYLNAVRLLKRKFSSAELLIELVISVFAGMLTYYLCIYANVPEPMQPILIAISGHMGVRAVYMFENFYDRLLPRK